MNKVIAIDPGGTTGVAAWNGVHFRSWEIPGGLLPAIQQIKTLLIPPCAALIYEKFEISASTVRTDLTDAYTALYINGAALVAACEAGVRIREQRPKDKAFANSNNWAALRAIDWYSTEGDGHRNDAAAHLLKYLTDTRQLPDFMLSKIVDMELGL